MVKAFIVLDDLRKYVAGMEMIQDCFTKELNRLRRDPNIQQHSIMLVEPKGFVNVFDESEIVSYISYYRENWETINVLGKLLPKLKERLGDLLAEDNEHGEEDPKK